MAEEMNKSPNEHAGSDRIRHQLEDTRSELGEKLECLQERVMDTVEKTRSTVEETVQSAKSTVQDTLKSIRSTFDLKEQVLRNTWPMMGGAFFAGMFLAHWSRGRRRSNAPLHDPGQPGNSAHRPEPASAGPAAASGLIASLKSRFHDELNTLERVAVGAGVNLLRDSIKRMMPALSARLEEEFRHDRSKTDDAPKDHPHNGEGSATGTPSPNRMNSDHGDSL